jgi:hypothetical protein
MVVFNYLRFPFIFYFLLAGVKWAVYVSREQSTHTQGNYEFGISRIIKSLEPYDKKLETDTW